MPAGNVETSETRVADFADLVREHQGMVYSIAYHFLHDRAAAEDLAQDVFLQLHQNLAALESPAHAAFWLRKVTSHRCIDYSRRRRLLQVSLENAPEPSVSAQAPDPFLAERLRKLIASLPEKSRILVILRYQEGLEPDEIARILDMPAGTVKSNLQRSLAILREKAVRYLGDVTL